MEELEKELQNLVALEAQIENLEAIRERIKNDGMSKSVALEARALVPDFDGNKPLALYSQESSYVRQVAAMEAASEAIGALIVAAALALSLLIAAALDFFFPKNKGKAGAGGGLFSGESKWMYGGKIYNTKAEADAARDEDVRKYKEEMLRRAEEAFRNRHNYTNGSSNSSHSSSSSKGPSESDQKKSLDALVNIDKLIEEEIKKRGADSPMARILVAEDPITYDLLTSGKYVDIMIRSLDIAPSMRKGLTALHGEIAGMTRDYPYVMDTSEIPQDGRKELMDRLPLSYKTQGKFRNTDWKIIGTIEQIDQGKAAIQMPATHKTFKYSELLKIVERVTSKLPVNKIIQVFKDCEDDLPDLEVKLKKLSEGMDKYKDRKDLTDFQQEYQAEAFSALKAIRQDVNGVIRYMQEFDRFGRHIRSLENRVTRMQTETVKLIAKYADEASGGLTPEMKKLRDEMLDNITITI